MPAELYNFDAAPYESLMLGLCSVLHSGPRAAGRPKINSVMLAFSRDGYHFDRPHREAVISVSDDPQGVELRQCPVGGRRRRDRGRQDLHVRQRA